MRTSISFFLVGLFSLTFGSCTKNDNVASDPSQAVVSGTWKVSLFSDNGTNETVDFNGYSFAFSTSGTITVVKSGVNQTGTWSVNGSSHKFSINLGPKDNTNIPLGELTDDWKILSSTSTEIRLGDDNSTSNELLTFSKN